MKFLRWDLLGYTHIFDFAVGLLGHMRTSTCGQRMTVSPLCWYILCWACYSKPQRWDLLGYIHIFDVTIGLLGRMRISTCEQPMRNSPLCWLILCQACYWRPQHTWPQAQSHDYHWASNSHLSITLQQTKALDQLLLWKGNFNPGSKMKVPSISFLAEVCCVEKHKFSN